MAKTFDEKINELTELKNSIDVSKLQKNKEICLKQLNNLLGDNMLDSDDDRVKTKIAELNDINNKIKLADKIVKDIDSIEKRREKIRELPIYSKTTKWVYELFKDDSVYKYAKKYGKKHIIEKIKNRSLSMDEYEKIYLEINYPNLSRKTWDENLWNYTDNQDKNKSNEKILENLWISYKKLDWEILPSEKSRNIVVWSWKWFELPWTTGKMDMLFKEILTEENCISQGDFDVATWIKIKNKLRQLPYVAVKIPKLNKTILINEYLGEATYIYDGILWDEDLLNIKKTSDDKKLHKFIFSTPNIWKENISESLWIQKEKRKEEIKSILLNPEMREKWNKLSVWRNRITFKLPDGTSYTTIARVFWFDTKRWPERKDVCSENTIYFKLSKIIYWNDSFVESMEDIKNELKKPEMVKYWFTLLRKYMREDFTLPNWVNYLKIARVFWIDGDRQRVLSYKTYKELWKRIYWDDYEIFNQKYWLEKNYENFVIENFVKWFKFTKKAETRRHFIFPFNGEDYWLTTITNLILWEESNQSTLYDEKNHISMSKKLFSKWELYNYLKKQQKLIIDQLKQDEKFKRKRFKTEPWNFHRIRFDWELNYVSLARILLFDQWINGNWDFDIYWINTYNQLTKIIFW